MLRELHLCNYSKEDIAFQDFLSPLSSLECLILDRVRQYTKHQNSSKKLKRLVLRHCDFLIFDINAPNLTSLNYENNRMLFYPVESYNVQDYIFSNCCHCSTGPKKESLKFESVKMFLMNSSNKLRKGTKMVLDLKWCNYAVLFEDWTLIAQLPSEAVDCLFPITMCISSMSFLNWKNGFCFTQGKLLVISSADSKLYKVLKKKRPTYYSIPSTFTMIREAFEKNTHLLPMDNSCGENIHKCAFFFRCSLGSGVQANAGDCIGRKSFQEE